MKCSLTCESFREIVKIVNRAGEAAASLSSEPQTIPVTLVCRNDLPALTGLYLVEAMPPTGFPDACVIFVSSRLQHSLPRDC